MANRVSEPNTIGNFKPSRGLRAGHENSDWRNERPGMSDQHLKNIRALPCCVCFAPGPSEAHHLKQTSAKERGASVKSTDRWTVPLCNEHHIHGVERAGSKNELSWFFERGVDALALAHSLWGTAGDVPKMIKIVLANRGTK